VLAGHEPYPAVVINRWWELLDANNGITLFTRDVAPQLLEPPVNVLRLSLHPDGMAPHIANLGQWRAHLLTQLHQRARTMGDQRLVELHDELSAYPGGTDTAAATDVVLPLRYAYGDAELSFFSISAAVDTATDVTVDELAIESFYPADATTAEALRSLS
jgi:hypothetical protein